MLARKQSVYINQHAKASLHRPLALTRKNDQLFRPAWQSLLLADRHSDRLMIVVIFSVLITIIDAESFFDCKIQEKGFLLDIPKTVIAVYKTSHKHQKTGMFLYMRLEWNLNIFLLSDVTKSVIDTAST